MKNIRNGNHALGVLILVIGALLLLKQIGVLIPGWIFSWPMILIAIGLYSGYKNGFQNTGSVVLLVIGGFFLLRDKVFLPFEIGPYLLPLALIFLGLFILFKKNKNPAINWTDWEGNYDKWEKKLRTENDTEGEPTNSSDYLNVEALFCGLKRKVMSKHFKGGEITTVFGGSDIDLMHADIEAQAVLKVSVVFGGVKLIVPPHWDVQLGVSNLAAGVEDKRHFHQATQDPQKRLVISGTVIFGGIEISSY
ncbi:Predicted membrane protein [Cyclobacterium xiamenense]|uniref:Predicted membrane protein n=1 Tax=Cyclobacterium xiamenense TaxID=1297121 RepID=A0A1H7AT57_9BACT|nr:DUF5668 domain-containing protein [Cyclobacterium xiamenense]SEJ68136.1 Predicted membrane protein [Cyclobacterium xiamenense]